VKSDEMLELASEVMEQKRELDQHLADFKVLISRLKEKKLDIDKSSKRIQDLNDKIQQAIEATRRPGGDGLRDASVQADPKP
jgi:uncharacterized protein (DUF885 family)